MSAPELICSWATVNSKKNTKKVQKNLIFFAWKMFECIMPVQKFTPFEHLWCSWQKRENWPDQCMNSNLTHRAKFFFVKTPPYFARTSRTQAFFEKKISYFCVIFLFCPGSSEPGRWNAALYFKSQNDYLIPQISHVICSYQGFLCHLTHVYFSRWYFIIWKIIFLS